ncbi:MAG TPA: MBL fold metallo-hydrolase [bacterium]|nr:MBL fold metallo-hydrolase [bacterium]
MNITFLGGAGEVTGSAHLIEANGARVLRDCGVFQGRRTESYAKNRELVEDLAGLQAMLISHAHADHSGNVPGVVKRGYKGPVYATPATADLLPLMWRDAARIQQADLRFLEKYNRKAPDTPEPLFDESDVDDAEKLLRPVAYGKELALADGLTVDFHEAGHILGSAVNVVTARENGRTTRVGWALDLGRSGLPILEDPHQLRDLDALVIESTYGAREHEQLDHLEERLADVLNRTFARGGKVIVPAFALGRAQEVLYSVKRLFNAGKVKKVPVFLDSPLADKVSQVFARHGELYDNETRELGHSFLAKGFVTYTTDKRESQKLNDFNGPCIIISSSGMCEAGRILHHLLHQLDDPKNTILIVGFMAEHTLGRKLLNGDQTVRVLMATVRVRAEITKLNAFSAHAGCSELLQYIKGCGNLKKLILVHGEATQLAALAEKARTVTAAAIHIPQRGETLAL